jgi:hypothetical protein
VIIERKREWGLRSQVCLSARAMPCIRASIIRDHLIFLSIRLANGWQTINRVSHSNNDSNGWIPVLAYNHMNWPEQAPIVVTEVEQYY